MCGIIILSHYEFLGDSETFGEFYKTYLHNPTLFVDYFFMLSGFGIFLSSKRPERSMKDAFNFALDKVRKIYPAYIFSLILGAIGVFIVTSGLIRAILKITIFGIADLTLFQSITGMTLFSHSLNGVCWFLSSLFICYMTCPWFLHVIDKLNNRKQAIDLICFLLFIVLTISFGVLFIERNLLDIFDDLWYGHPFIRCWYLAIGMCLGYLYRQSKAKIGSRQETLVAVTAIAKSLGRNSIPVRKELLRPLDLLICILFQIHNEYKILK